MDNHEMASSMDSDRLSTHSRRQILGVVLGTAAAVGNAVLGAANSSRTPTSFRNTDAGEAGVTRPSLGSRR
jgi:hypothetical protein